MSLVCVEWKPQPEMLHNKAQVEVSLPHSGFEMRGFANILTSEKNTMLSMYNWLVVSTHLQNINQNGNLPQVGMKLKNNWNHHLDKYTEYRDEINMYIYTVIIFLYTYRIWVDIHFKLAICLDPCQTKIWFLTCLMWMPKIEAYFVKVF